MIDVKNLSLADHFHGFEMKSVNPLILHVALTSAILDIFGRSSNSITKWMSDCQRITIELSTTQGILPTQSPIHQLLPEEFKVLNQIPTSISTVFGWLEVDPRLTFMNCCNACFAMYPETSTPTHCHHRIADMPVQALLIPVTQTTTVHHHLWKTGSQTSRRKYVASLF